MGASCSGSPRGPVGALVGVAVAAIIGASQGGALIAIVIGAVVGVWPGGFYFAAARLPVNGDTYDARGGEPTGSDWISVSGPESGQQLAEDIMTAHHASTVNHIAAPS